MGNSKQWTAKWIKGKNVVVTCPEFFKDFTCGAEVQKATLCMTGIGVYTAAINGKRVGKAVLAPGWTSYKKRLQYQEYDVTELIEKENEISVVLAPGWYRGRLAGWGDQPDDKVFKESPAGILAEITIVYKNGKTKTVATDSTWNVSESNLRFCEIYDGVEYDASKSYRDTAERAEEYEGPWNTLIPQQGTMVMPQETVEPVAIFTTPKNETVIDFGQNLSGAVRIELNAKAGDAVEFSHAEVLDKEGNFYTANYRSAKAKYTYICKDGPQVFCPEHTFFGFRYIRLDRYPGLENADDDKLAEILSEITAVVYTSEMKRTGRLSTSDPMLNKLFSNAIWGQKSNFVDVPTDCPQRDERMGWTGDAQIFIRTACYNYDAEKFYTKWLADVAADQGKDGRIPHVVPNTFGETPASAAWGDCATVCPWEVYLAYGNKKILKDQYDSMKKWVSYITSATHDKYLWTGCWHFGDWLGLDAPQGSYTGSTRNDFIASAFYAYSTERVIKAGKALGVSTEKYEKLYNNIRKKFNETFTEYTTQTECVLAIYFRLTDNPKKTGNQLAKMIKEAGNTFKTGFVGAPYLLHALTMTGHTKLAFTLLMNKNYPCWLYAVSKGATTIWEHWDGIMQNGDFWSSDMNSFNHYSYGSVTDWVYGVAAGITPVESAPGYREVEIAPHADKRLGWLKAELDTKYGTISSFWTVDGDKIRYDITTPVKARITIEGETKEAEPGTYVFYSELC